MSIFQIFQETDWYAFVEAQLITSNIQKLIKNLEFNKAKFELK